MSRLSRRDGFWGLAGAVAISFMLALPVGAKEANARPGKDASAPRTLDEAVARLERKDGLLTVYLDRPGGRVLVALRPSGPNGELGQFIYQVYLRSGLGSTPVGLDRSAVGRTHIVAFRRAGRKVFADLQNTGFNADQGSQDEKVSVRDSFASSTIWSGAVEGEASDGTVVVDFSSFLTQDNFGAAGALKDAKQGKFTRDGELSYPDVAATQVFPENLELEAHQTFRSEEPGSEVKDIVPEPGNVTLVQHHSLIKLPAPGYKPRLLDPRVGGIATSVADYSAPLGAPVVYRLAHRFRLEKTDPGAARSQVVRPIVFYVDRAAPEPVRSALMEGARWWAEAFDAAGFIDAFRVEVLPEGVSPLDARYNVINWVHRQTRGWSYGATIIDPRTGEIVKGNVLLGSLRMRQDRLIFEGLAGAAKTGTGAPDDPIGVVLARLRQLAVHETGHSLGLEHNFAGSTFDDRASVMDYPAPRVKIAGDQLDFRDAYKAGLGSWDRFSIRWLYDQQPPGKDQQQALDAMVREGYANGFRFVTDEDARPIGSFQPYGSLWDDGPDAVTELAHVLNVRRIALERFGPGNLPKDEPLSELRRVIVPVYLFHRYEVDAVAKSIGGAVFTYAVNGDRLPASTPLSGAEQRRALGSLLATLDPKVLDLPDSLIDLLSAGQSSTSDKQYDIEIFRGARPPAFSLEAAAGAAADITLADLLEPSRLERLEGQSGRDPGALGLPEMLSRTVAVVFAPEGDSRGHRPALRRYVQARLVTHLVTAMEDPALSQTAAADIRASLVQLGQQLAKVKHASPEDQAAAQYYVDLLSNLTPERAKALIEKGHARPGPPPGMPIGSGGEDDWFAVAGEVVR